RGAGWARIEGLLKCDIGRSDVLAGEVFCQSIRDDDRVVSLIKVRKIAAIFLETGKDLPAQTVAERQTAVYLIFVLSEEAILCSSSADIWAGDSEVQRSRSAFKKIA